MYNLSVRRQTILRLSFVSTTCFLSSPIVNLDPEANRPKVAFFSGFTIENGFFRLMVEAIELHDSFSDELSDATLNSSRVSSTSCDSPARLPSDAVKYDPSSIKMLAKEQPEKYVLINNQKMNSTKTPPCWKWFASPAVAQDEASGHRFPNENGENHRCSGYFPAGSVRKI